MIHHFLYPHCTVRLVIPAKLHHYRVWLPLLFASICTNWPSCVYVALRSAQPRHAINTTLLDHRCTIDNYPSHTLWLQVGYQKLSCPHYLITGRISINLLIFSRCFHSPVCSPLGHFSGISFSRQEFCLCDCCYYASSPRVSDRNNGMESQELLNSDTQREPRWKARLKHLSEQDGDQGTQLGFISGNVSTRNGELLLKLWLLH